MNRRKFLRHTATAGTGIMLSSLFNGLGAKAINALPAFATPAANSDTDHVLVLIQLGGGNDGLNTVVPIDQFGNLADARPQVLLPEDQLLALDGIDNAKLHPAMTGMQQLYNQGKVQIIQSVGYPDPNYSHFRATDILMSASDADQVLNTGWLGRYLNYEYANYPTGYPNEAMPHPLAVELGYSLSLALQGPLINMGYAISDPTYFYNLTEGIQTPAPNTKAGEQLAYIRLIAQQSRQYNAIITAANDAITTQSEYPDSFLAQQLRIVARMVAGGLKTRFYIVHLDGFDTHDNQMSEHANLLQELSDALLAFQNDLEFLGIADRVLSMTVSEFGRRIIGNDSAGTDHGAAAPMFIVGNAVNSGILGDTPLIPAGANEDDNLPMQYDFRSVYASILKQWFCVPNSDLPITMLQTFPQLPIIDPSANNCISTSVHELNQQAGQLLINAYPNPFWSSTQISFNTEGGHTLVQIFNGSGQLVKTLCNGIYAAGKHSVSFDSEWLPNGIYYCRLQNGALQQIKPLVKTQ
jgi:uncharacterized protein (DUF1501 family)